MANYLQIYDLNYSPLCILNDNTLYTAKNIKVEYRINGIDKLTFELPLASDKWKYIINENLAKFKGQYYFIRTPKFAHSENGASIVVECLHLSSSLQRKLCAEITEMEGVGKTAEQLMNLVLTDSKWTVGTIDSDIASKYGDLIVKEQPAFANLVKIAERFQGFLEFDSSLKTVSLTRNKVDRDIHIRKGKNLQSIDVEYDTNDLVTRLYAFGGDDPSTGEEVTILGAYATDDNGNILYKKDANGNYILNIDGQKIPTIIETSYLEDYSFYIAQGYDIVYIQQHPELFLSESTWSASEYVDTQLLYEDAKKKLKVLAQPKMTCSVQSLDLSMFPEYFTAQPIIGEVVHIFDEDLNIAIEAQVVGITKNYDNPLDLKIDIANEIEYSSILQQLIETSTTIKRTSNPNGTIRSSFIQGALDILKTKLNSNESKWYTDAQGNIVFESLDGTKCMKLGGGIFAIANSKDVNGDWNWKAFGDGDGFTADQIITGLLKGGSVEWNLDDVSRAIYDINGNTLYTLPAGAFLIGNTITDYKLYFDGADLHFGSGSITWDNLDTQTQQNLTPNTITIAIADGVRNFTFNKDGVNQTTPTAYSVDVKKNGSSITPTSVTWAYGGFLSGNTSKPTVGAFATTDTYVQATVVVDGSSYVERIPISASKVGDTGASGSSGTSGNSTAILYKRYYTQPSTPTGNSPSGWYSDVASDTTKFGYVWFVQGIKDSTGNLVGSWSTPFPLDDVDSNLLWDKKWTIGTGTDGVYTANETITGENKREIGDTPFGTRDIIWRAISNDTTTPTNGDGGWTVDNIPIDSIKQYRISVFVKQLTTNGTVNIGCSTTSTNNLDGTSNTNPYFYSGDMPTLAKWYLVVGFVNSSSDTSTTTNASAGIYDILTGQKVPNYNFTTFKNKSGAMAQSQRVFQNATNVKGSESQFYAPRFDVIDGTELSINDLLKIGLQGNYVDNKYMRSATQPTTPTDANPSGWLDSPPTGTDKLWMIKATKKADGTLVGTWSTPIQINGDSGTNGDYYVYQYSIDGVNNWHTTYAVGDLYLRQKLSLASTWGNAIKFVGEDGTDGANGTSGGYTDYKFMRSVTQPSTPTGNSPAGWSDAPPIGTDKLWMIKGTKDANGTLQGTWSTPIQLNGDKGSNGDSFSLIVSDGIRSITYDASGGNPNPSTSTAFRCTLYKNGIALTSTDYTYSWSASGHISGTATTATFTPLIDNAFDSTDNNNYVTLTVDYNGTKISSYISIAVTRDASGLDWVNEWNNGATMINGQKVITPRLFAGQNDATTGLTGIAIGKDVMNGSTNNLIGIIAYKNNNATFQLDANGNIAIGMAGKRQIKVDTNGNVVLPTIIGSDVDVNFGKTLPLSGNPALDGKADKNYVDTINNKVVNNTSDIQDMKTYFDFTNDGLVISKNDGTSTNPLQITIDNSSIQFIDTNPNDNDTFTLRPNAIAYINGKKMYIDSLQVLSNAIMGVHKIEKYNSDVTLIKWVGGN